MGKDDPKTNVPARDPAAPQPVDPKQQQQDHLLALRAQVVSPWGELIDKLPPATDANAIKALRLTTYKNLFEKIPGYEPFAAYFLADPALAPYAAAAKEADVTVTADRPLYLEITTALVRLMVFTIGKSDDVLHEVHGTCLAAYARMSVSGRYYLKDRPMVDGCSVPEVKTLLKGEGKLVPLEPVEKAADKPAPEDATLKPMFEGLKKQVLATPSTRDPAAKTKRDELKTALGKTDLRVLDMLRGDREVSIRISELTEVDKFEPNASSLLLDLDSAQQLYWSLNQDNAATQFVKVKGFLEARPGITKEAVANRQRVMTNQYLMNVITTFSAGQQAEITRLIARGTAAKGPADVLEDPTASAEDALRAALEIVRLPTFADMHTDPLFRTAIEKGNNKKPATIDGLSASAYDTCLRGWGVIPNAPVKDPESALPTAAINPTDDPPPDAAGMARIEAMFPPTVEKLAKEFDSTFYVSDKVIVKALTDFENDCAKADIRDLFRRAHLIPGVELTKRANANSKIGNIRDKLHKGLDADARQVAERILGINIDAATVGKIDGSVALVGEIKPGGKLPLDQALREVKLAGDATMSQVTRNHIESLVGKLNAHHLYGGCAAADITAIYNDYKGKFGCASETAGKRVIDDLCSLTGLHENQIHPIEFLVNAFREHPDAKGDLAQRITERVHDGDQAACLTSIDLDPGQVAGRVAAAKAAAAKDKEGAAGGPSAFAPDVKDLYEKLLAAQVTVGNRPKDAECTAAGQAWAKAKGLMAQAAPANAAPAAPGAAPADSFGSVYQKTYGIEPHRHVIEIVRALGSGFGTPGISAWVPKVAAMMQVSVDEVQAEVKATTVVKDDAPPLASGFTVAEAKIAAKAIWDGLHAGDVVPVRSKLEGQRPEEQALIKQCFKMLSGDVELEFYVRQALENSQHGGNTFKAAGGAGVHAAGEVTGGGGLANTSDTSSWQETLDVAKNGRVGILLRVSAALGNSDKNEIFDLVDKATVADRKEILGDDPTMGQIRAKLPLQGDFDRVYKTLTGTADMATRLYSRSDGNVDGGFWRGYGTDTKGIEADIKAYANRRKEFHSRALEDAGDMPDKDPNFRDKVTAKVKLDLLATYENPDVRKVIEADFNTGWIFKDAGGLTGDGRKVEGELLNGGSDANVGSIAADGFEWSSDILAQVKAMTPAQRQKYRVDPVFLQKVGEKCTDQQNRKFIIIALQSDEPAGADHIIKLCELQARMIQLTDGDARAAVAAFTQGELDRLRAEPALVSTVCEVIVDEAERTRFRAILGLTTASGVADLNDPKAAHHFNIKEVPGPVGATGGAPASNYQLGPDAAGIIDKAEMDRLALLKLESQQRLHIAAKRSWSAMLGEAVAVYNADFTPKFQKPAVSADPPGAGSAQADLDKAAAQQAKLGEEAKAHDTKFREMVWDDVKDDAFKVADENTKDDKNDAVIWKAVLKKPGGDPSSLRLKDSFSGIASTFNDDTEIEKTIKEASDDHILNEWSSVIVKKFDGDGGGSFKDIYNAYATAKGAVTPGAPASPDATLKLTAATRAFQEYVVEPSMNFENLVLPSAGSWLKDKDKTTKPDQQLTRKNPQFAKYRGFLNDRIRTLDYGKVATTMGIAAGSGDAQIVASRLRGALTDFQQAKEDYAKNRGIDGQGTFASDEGRRLDQAFGDYREEINDAKDGASGGEISDRKKRSLDQYDEDFKARATEYTAAKDEAAKIAGQVVAAVIALAITAFTFGAGSVAGAAFYGAVTAALAATGQVVTEQAIKGGANYDMGAEGARTVATAAITGAVSAGSLFYAGQLTKAILPSLSAAAQGTQLGVAAAAKPSIWQNMFKAGLTTTIQSTATGLSDAVGSGLNPTVWVHGWDEGWYRALDKVGETVGQKPAAIFKDGITAMIGAGLVHPITSKMGGGGDDPKPGEMLGISAVLKQAGSDLPQNVATNVAATGFDVATGQVKSGKQAASSVVQGTLAGVSQTGLGMHEGSVNVAEASRFGLGELSANPDALITPHERESYLKAVEGSYKDGGAPAVREFAAMRDVIARGAIGDNPKFKTLTSEDQRKFVDFVRAAGSNEEMTVRGGRDPHEAIGVGVPKVVYPAGSELAKARDLATIAGSAAAELGDLHADLMAHEEPKSQAEATASLDKATAAQKTAADHVALAADSVAKIKVKLEQAPKDSPEQLELAKQLDIASSAMRRAETLKTLIELSKASLLRHASGAGFAPKDAPAAKPFDASKVKAGEVPADAPSEVKAQFEQAKKLYDDAKANPYAGEKMAELRWSKYLQDHGIAAGKSSEGLKDGIIEIEPPKPKVEKADQAVANNGLVGARSANMGELSPAVATTAFTEVANAASGFERVKVAGNDLHIKVKTPPAGEKEQIIRLKPPAGTADGQLAGLRANPDGTIDIWLSDKICDDQATRAMGGIVAQAVAVASKGGDPSKAAVYGQIDAMLIHLDAIAAKPLPGKATGGTIAEISASAKENSKYESPARLNAELDMMLLQLGADQPGPAREKLLTELPPATAAKLKLHLEARATIGFNAGAVDKQGAIPKPAAADDTMPKSSVLPGTPTDIHPYSAADRKAVMELQLVFEQIKECDVRIAQRDQKNTAGAEIAKGETLRRGELVKQSQKLLHDLQLGGTDKAYYDARLAELEKIFPGVDAAIKPGVDARVTERNTMEEFHRRASEFRAKAIEQSAAYKARVKGKSPFFTDRVIVGDGIAGLTDAATLKNRPAKGDTGFIDPAQLLVLGGADLLARMAAADPTMRWGQRAEVFDPAKGLGQEHAMFKGGGEGDLQGANEDAGDFATVGAMNDAMDLARQRLGIARVDATVISVETKTSKRADTPAWHADGAGYEVRVRIMIDGVIQEVYTHNTDITTGLGALAAPDESLLSKEDREALFKSKAMMGGDSIMTSKETKASMAGMRVFVFGYGPTAAWAAIEAARAGAARVDWTGTSGIEGAAGNQKTLEGLSSVDRVAETKNPAAAVHTSLDRVVGIKPQGDGAVVTFAHGEGAGVTTYEVHYDKVMLSMGYDSTGARPTNDPTGGSKSILGDTKMQGATNGAPVLESKDANGAVRVLGGAGFGDVNTDMTPEQKQAYMDAKKKVAVSADSPMLGGAGDPRVMEFQGDAIEKANQGPTPAK